MKTCDLWCAQCGARLEAWQMDKGDRFCSRECRDIYEEIKARELAEGGRP